jgi:hypothetical protein
MITDELREWTRIHTVNCSDNRIALVAIADRIDAEHRKALEKVAAMVDEDTARGEYTRGYNGGYDAAADMLDDLERRVSAIERKLNHRGER